MKVLITTSRTADDRKTLAAVRALGRAGAHVAVGGNSFARQPFFSRYCKRRVALPNPREDPEAYHAAVVDSLRRERYDVLLPLDDYTTASASRHRTELRQYTGLLAPHARHLDDAHDKWQARVIAERIGIEVPKARLVDQHSPIEDLCAEIGFPCLLKPLRGAGAEGQLWLDSREQPPALAWQEINEGDHVYDRSRMMVQEHVPGEVHDVCLLFKGGEPRAALTQRRLRMYPVRGGPGVYNETTDEPELRDLAIRFLGALDWEGPAQVEFLIDARDGVPKLIDVNARFWGTLDLAIRAGVDFPTLACRIAMDGDIAPVYDYQVGLRYRWPIPHGILCALRSRDSLRALCDFLRPGRDVVSDVRVQDLVPNLVDPLLRSARVLRGSFAGCASLRQREKA